jgi:hypothetical protein
MRIGIDDPKITKQKYTECVLEAWNRIPRELIVKGFKQNGLSVALDGSEDHLVKIDFDKYAKK